jgi:pentatricopeptide repeat protein
MFFRSAPIKAGRVTLPICSSHSPRLLRLYETPLATQRTLFIGTTTPQKLQTIVERLEFAVYRTRQISDIRQYYLALAKQVTTQKSPPPLSRPQVLDILDALAGSGRPGDLALIDKILSDLPEVFGFEADADAQMVILRALLRRGNLQTVLNWLRNMKLKPGKIKPSLEQWHLFLHQCVEKGDVGLLRTGMQTMPKSGCPPTNETFEIRLGALFESNARLESFVDIIKEMHLAGLPYSSHVSSLLYNGFSKVAMFDHARKVKMLYESPFQAMENVNSPDLQVEPWNEELGFIAESEGLTAAIRRYRTLRKRGAVASKKTLSIMLRHSTSVTELRDAARHLDVVADEKHWTLLVTNTLNVGDIPNALKVYSAFREENAFPSLSVIHPIITALCRTATLTRSEQLLDQAIDLYRDLASAVSLSSSGSYQGPDVALYSSLLRAVASALNDKKYYSLAVSLLKEMRLRQIDMDDSMTIASVTVLSMRNSPSFSDALTIYKHLCNRDDGTRLNERGFEIVLDAFCKLSYGEGSIPPLDHYFAIVKDMRNAGYGMTVQVYAMLLKQFAALATRNSWDPSLPEEFRDKLGEAIRRTHDYLTLDASISPDVVLWTQLMDAYQRCGLFGEAYRVWDTMYLSGQYNDVSVTIIFDACGFAGVGKVAEHIWTNLQRDGYVFSQKNWQTWLECLCRLGRINDALKILCLEMGKEPDGGVPDEACVRILLSFASRRNQETEVRSRIRRYLPEVWETLPMDVREGHKGDIR